MLQDLRTQKATILDQLRLWGDSGVCATTLLSMRIPRYAARIKELRDDGHRIETVPCLFHPHKTRQVRYVLTPDLHAGQLSLLEEA